MINLNEAKGIRNYSTIYALPKTVVRVNVEVVKTTYKTGPYYQYAESLLGLTDAIDRDKEFWKITGIKFDTYAIVDTNNVFLVEANNNKVELNLTASGLLESIYSKGESQLLPIDEYKSMSVLNVSDLRSHKLVENENVNFDDVPLPSNVVAKKNEREQATELSKKILTLRDDRSAILVGDGYTETMPGGEALKIMIDKIDLIQEQYISLFKGKVKKETFKYSFDYIPVEPRKITQTIIFRFSEEHGIVDIMDMNGMPMILEIESYENLKNLEKFKKNQEYLKRAAKIKGTANGLFYRIPEMGIVRLLANEDVLMQEKFS
ncbi:MAG: DUF4831 family protein [Chloroflexia bacterium]|nr:DUF4831 family protein [Chloroflexia bacterium]